MGRIHRLSEDWDRKRRRPVSAEITEAGKVIDEKTGKEVSQPGRAYVLGKFVQAIEDATNSPEIVERLQHVVELFQDLEPELKKVEPFVKSSGLRAYLNKKHGKNPEEVFYTDVHLMIRDYFTETDIRKRGKIKALARKEYGKDTALFDLIEKTFLLIDEYKKML